MPANRMALPSSLSLMAQVLQHSPKRGQRPFVGRLRWYSLAPLMPLMLPRLRTALAARADECASSVDALASTLLAVAVKGDRFILLHIGDGVIGCLHDNRLVVLSQPVNGEFINTTVFVTSPEATDTMKLVKGDVSDIYGFVLLSDGTEMSLYDRQQKTLAPVLHRVFNAVCEEGRANVEEMLRGSFENSVIQATGDDCSIALMVRNIKS